MSGGWTKGEWHVFDQRDSHMLSLGWEGPLDDQIIISAVSAKEAIESGGRNAVIARIKFENRTEKLGESNLADALLIAEAGTVANETGLTPRQLADQNKELLAALAPFAEIQTGFAEYLSQDFERAKIKVADVQFARAVIAKCTGAA